LSTAREAAFEVINRASTTKSYANILLPKVLRLGNLSAVDRGLATQLAYGVLRNKGTLDWIIGQYSDIVIKKINIKMLDILRLGAYQIYYLDKVPDHAAVNESVELSKKYFQQKKNHNFVNAVLRAISKNKKKIKFTPLKSDFANYLSVRYSHPRWMIDLMLKQYNKRTAEAICKANNRTPQLSLTVNTIRISPEALFKNLKKKGYEASVSKVSTDSILLSKAGDVSKVFGYKEGLFFAQDESANLVAHVVGAEKGQRVIDCCAAPGGKTVHMAALMKNKGYIFASDISGARLALLDNLRDRLNVRNVILLTIDARRLIKYVKRTVDKILVDAPCSGLGTLARRADERWHKSYEQIQKLSKLQFEILDSLTTLVKKKGSLIYSVCTYTKEETEDVCKKFLEAHPEFKVENIKPYLPTGIKANSDYGIQLLPHHYQSDGMFIARFIKEKK